MKKLLAALPLLMLSLGCGYSVHPSRAAVEGTVLVDGLPLIEGVITLIPGESVQGPSTGARVTEGRYRIPRESGPFVGEYRVELTAMRMADGSPLRPTSGPPSGGDDSTSSKSGNEIVQFIPSEYNKESKLKLDVKPGENKLDIDVQLKPDKK